MWQPGRHPKGREGRKMSVQSAGGLDLRSFSLSPLLWPATQASQGKILGPNRFEPRISDVPGREEGTALITELWTGLWGV